MATPDLDHLPGLPHPKQAIEHARIQIFEEPIVVVKLAVVRPGSGGVWRGFRIAVLRGDLSGIFQQRLLVFDIQLLEFEE